MRSKLASCKLVVSALVVGVQAPDLSKLMAIFRTNGWELACVRTRAEARAYLKLTPMRVVIAESELPDDGWREMLEDLRQNPEPPVLVVTARLADEALWAEVINMGGYDVLAKPLDTEEVSRVIGAALRHFENERHAGRAPAKPVIMSAGFAKAAEVA